MSCYCQGYVRDRDTYRVRRKQNARKLKIPTEPQRRSCAVKPVGVFELYMGVPGVGSSLQAKMPGQKSIGNLKAFTTVTLEVPIEARMPVLCVNAGGKRKERKRKRKKK